MSDTTLPRIHPAADIFPRLDADAFAALKVDIEKNGQREPIVYWCGQLVDGRNRWKACQELGIQAFDCELDEDADPVAYVLSANLHRRQLKASQKAICAAKLAQLPRGKPGDNPQNCGITCEQAAKLFGVGTRSIEAARKVLSEGCSSLIAYCESGQLPVSTAERFIAKVPDRKEQARIAKKSRWRGGPKEVRRVADPPLLKKSDQQQDLHHYLQTRKGAIEGIIVNLEKVPADGWAHIPSEWTPVVSELADVCRRLAGLLDHALEQTDGALDRGGEDAIDVAQRAPLEALCDRVAGGQQ